MSTSTKKEARRGHEGVVDVLAGDMESLHENIRSGEIEVPPWWTRVGRKYRRWVKDHERRSDRLEQLRHAAGGLEPVVGEDPLPAPGVHGIASRGGGNARVVSGPTEWQTTTNLGAGFNPNVIGAPAPMIGTPLGRHVTTSMDVGCDAFAWFREGIIANPSAFVLSLPGLGQSTLIRKMFLGHVAQGHVPIIAGDVKAEYVGFTQAVGGQVITLGHGVGSLNPLDVGALGRIIPQLEAAGKKDLVATTKEQVHGRQVAMVRSLVGLARANNPAGHGVADYEAMALSVGLRELYASLEVDCANPPTLQDLIDQINQGSQGLRDKLRVRTEEQWHERIDWLLLSLNSLLDGATGQIFSGQTTDPIDVTSPAVCIDVSALDSSDRSTKAAVVVACWSNAFGSIEAAHILADAGLIDQLYFTVALDEMWQTLAVGAGMVSEVDALTRLNRTTGTALYMITHTFKDLQALPTEEDRKTAMGFIERAGMVICGGLPLSELDILSSMLPFTQAEAQMITSWSKGAAPKRARTQGANATPPGRGRFMIKPSKDGSPGIPIQTMLFPTEYEHRIHDTNMRFDAYFARGQEGV